MNNLWLRDSCYKICTNCEICEKLKRKRKCLGFRPRFEKNNNLQKFSVDICGPFIIEPDCGVHKRVYIITMINSHSKFVKVDVLNDLSATETVKVLKKMFLKMSVPLQLFSDNRVQIRSAVFRDLMQKMGIAYSFSRIYNPRANSKSNELIKQSMSWCGFSL
ncbi:transposable element [Pseudoloma neurophilia]|uniref:Transposable element n=1 Tax=Pseudoloma neurophilia TaxID=146866 RepID=A0A0R0M3R2_9MICR|nr:transposable element [Pseudoloma neurophilia]